jgi:predicted 2-oxoglutarate/Fe(II)-dependent dioxygenase YbiX
MQGFKGRHALYNNILNDEEIEKMLKFGNDGKISIGKVGTSVNSERKVRYDISMQNIDSIREIDQLIYCRIKDQINHDFNIDWKYREQWKMGYYDGEQKGFYDQHRDTYGPMAYRKISLIIALSDPNDYEGGELHFSELNKSYKLEKGSIIVFKSNEMHGVTPVTSGKRKVIISFGFDMEGREKKYELDSKMNYSRFEERYVPLVKSI